MTDIEFAKEVAEKVWGWKIVKNPTLLHLPEGTIVFIEPGSLPHLVNSYFEAYRLRDEVNSWAGFGRTVEAMRKIDYHPSIKARIASYFKCYLERTRFNNTEEIIKDTHRAALDAVKTKEEK